TEDSSLSFPFSCWHRSYIVLHPPCPWDRHNWYKQDNCIPASPSFRELLCYPTLKHHILLYKIPPAHSQVRPPDETSRFRPDSAHCPNFLFPLWQLPLRIPTLPRDCASAPCFSV